MTFLELNHPNRPALSRALIFSSFIIICFLAWIWGWKTSGVLENTMFFDINPLGYACLLDTQQYGIWPINRESLYYLNGMQAFLEVPGTNINLGNGYEISRTLYCLLLRSFWFLEPIVASFVLDILLWFLAALSAAYIAGTFSKNKITPWFAAMMVIFGQGFLHSVGEGIPHVLGYAGGFYVGALICLFHTWHPRCRFSEDLVVYVFLGLWQLGYGTALFFLPLALLSTLHRLRSTSVPLKKILMILGIFILVGLLPFSVITLTAKWVTQMPGEMNMVLKGISSTYSSISSYLAAYIAVFLDGLLSLGPIIVLCTFALLYFAIWGKYRDLKYLFLVFLLPYLGMVFLITPLSGRGYATYNLVLIPVIFAALLLGNLIEIKKFGKILAIIAVFVLIGYPNSMKLGYMLPGHAFHLGWFSHNLSNMKTYAIYLFQ